MKPRRPYTAVAAALAIGLLALGFWVSRIPYMEEVHVSTPPAVVPLTPIFLTITSPSNRVVGTPRIQIQGNFVGNAYKLSVEAFAAKGQPTNAANYGVSWNTAMGDSETNWFQSQPVALAGGTNLITVRAFFEDDRILTNQATYVLDYSSFTNPPGIKILWPSNETMIAGSAFTLRAQVADPSTSIHVSVLNAQRPALEFDDVFMDNTGGFAVKDLPLSEGTNQIVVLATDAAGHSSTTNLHLVQSGVKITMRPIHWDQFNYRSATVAGWINDARLAVSVNGTRANVSTNGQWTAEEVPFVATKMTTPRRDPLQMGFRRGGSAYFTISAFDGKKLVATEEFEAN